MQFTCNYSWLIKSTDFNIVSVAYSCIFMLKGHLFFCFRYLPNKTSIHFWIWTRSVAYQWKDSKCVWCISTTEGALETFAQMEREREVQSRSGDCAVSRRSKPVINVKDNVLGKWVNTPSLPSFVLQRADDKGSARWEFNRATGKRAREKEREGWGKRRERFKRVKHERERGRGRESERQGEGE